MPEDKHTPGPWVHDPAAPQYVYSDDATGSILARCGGTGFEFVHRDREEIVANARMIAAAPDMLEALRELADLVETMLDDEYTPDSFTTQPARAAIAKATGP